ncbi:MAG: MBL fold metallo-hydrolase [Candidatus Gastranaerophilaceae bacterium]
MILKQFTLGALEDNNYLLIDDGENGSKEAVLIDCTEYSEDIANTLNEHGATLKYILLTHGHFDHVLGVNDFKAKYDCKVLINEADQAILDTMSEFTKNFLPINVEVQKVDGYVKEDDIIKFGKNEIRVIDTSGHTKGGVCYLIDGIIFTGDTIFRGAVGRTDLIGGSFSQLKSNIEKKIFTLDENIKIYPGHGPSSTIGWEKEHNKFL